MSVSVTEERHRERQRVSGCWLKFGDFKESWL
jgi:hypothetical protein